MASQSWGTLLLCFHFLSLIGQKSLLRSRKPGVLQFMGSQRVGHDLGIEQNNNNQRVNPLLVFARARKNQWEFREGSLELTLVMSDSLRPREL